VASGTVMLRRWIRLDQRAGGERAAGNNNSLSLHLEDTTAVLHRFSVYVQN
jgi:hypothetical protein